MRLQRQEVMRGIKHTHKGAAHYQELWGRDTSDPVTFGTRLIRRRRRLRPFPCFTSRGRLERPQSERQRVKTPFHPAAPAPPVWNAEVGESNLYQSHLSPHFPTFNLANVAARRGRHGAEESTFNAGTSACTSACTSALLAWETLRTGGQTDAV